MIDFHQLRIFVAVYECRSFSKAGKKVYLTQPTVSGHVAALEESLKTRLFDRAGREVLPTKAGELLYPLARRTLHMLREAEEEVASFLGGETGELSIGGSNIPGQYILPRLVGAFKAMRPEARVVLRVGDTAAVADMVEAGDIEIGMIGAALNRPGLVFEPCADDLMVLIVPPGHRLAGVSEAVVEEVAREPFVVREQGSGTRLVIERALKAAGFKGLDAFPVAAEMGSTEAVRQAVKAGVGLAIISRRAVRDDADHGLLSIVELNGVDLARRFFLVWRKRRSLSPLATDFCSIAREACAG